LLGQNHVGQALFAAGRRSRRFLSAASMKPAAWRANDHPVPVEIRWLRSPRRSSSIQIRSRFPSPSRRNQDLIWPRSNRKSIPSIQPADGRFGDFKDDVDVVPAQRCNNT